MNFPYNKLTKYKLTLQPIRFLLPNNQTNHMIKPVVNKHRASTEHFFLFFIFFLIGFLLKALLVVVSYMCYYIIFASLLGEHQTN